jgi:putative drug exporter of the RND superfamily
MSIAAVHDGRVARAVAGVGRACARHRIVVIGAWILLALALLTWARVAGTPTDNDVSLPGTDSQQVRDLTQTSATPLTTGQVILVAPSGRLDDPDRAEALAATTASLRLVTHVSSVQAPARSAGTLSADGRTGWFTLGIDVRRANLTKDTAQAATAAAGPAADAGLRVIPGGALAQVVDGSGGHASEVVGLVLAGVVLLFALGGALGASLTILTAALSLVVTVETVGLAGNLIAIPTVATTLATMVGLGVGIDYSLFLISRFRELMRVETPVADAIGQAVGDSGTAVTVAGATVAVALAGLGLTGVPLLQTVAWTTGVAVLFAVLAALTLLPALLSVAGRRVARGGLLLNLVRRRLARDRAAGFWERQAARVTRRPWLVGGAALVMLILLAAPAVDLRLGQLDAGSSPPSTAVRQADDALSAAFGPGTATPLTVAAELPTPGGEAVSDFVSAVGAQSGVAAVGPVTMHQEGRVAVAPVIASTAGSDPATTDLVHRLRAMSVPDVTVHVGGTTAARADLAERVSATLPLVIGAVLLLSMAVLLVAFRAPLVALKAAAMDLISIGAAYGALTAVFTWGWGVTWLGLSGPVPIPSYVPLMLFALLFGLSMDYEVFLLSVVRRRWLATGDNLGAVREGLSATGSVITAAATIMIGVFLAFVSNDDPTIKMFGVAMAVAIAVDAILVRGLLVPATMAMLGDLTWWTPRRRPIRGWRPARRT